MATHYDEVWRFETARFAIIAEVTPEDCDPADLFEDDRDIEAVWSGEVKWFAARVRVESLETGLTLGEDHLGGCAYSDPIELFRHHASGRATLRRLRGKTDRASRRERKQVREWLKNNASLTPRVTYCEYGPSMVCEAILAARKTLAALRA